MKSFRTSGPDSIAHSLSVSPSHCPHNYDSNTFGKEIKSQVIQPLGALAVQWVKHWPTDLAVPSSSPARAEIFTIRPISVDSSKYTIQVVTSENRKKTQLINN